MPQPAAERLHMPKTMAQWVRYQNPSEIPIEFGRQKIGQIVRFMDSGFMLPPPEKLARLSPAPGRWWGSSTEDGRTPAIFLCTSEHVAIQMSRDSLLRYLGNWYSADAVMLAPIGNKGALQIARAMLTREIGGISRAAMRPFEQDGECYLKRREEMGFEDRLWLLQHVIDCLRS